MTPSASSSRLAGRLGITDQFIKPGYEDVFYYLWRERRLPVNVDPFDSRLDDEMERVRLRRVFEQKLDAVVGYVLPLQARDEDEHQRGRPGPAGPWFLRDERMYLIPGDSPMGYRLPLDALPWASTADQDYLVASDPMAPRGTLPASAELEERYAERAAADERRTSLPYLAGVTRQGEAPRRTQDGLVHGDVGFKPAAAGQAVPGEPLAAVAPPARHKSAKGLTRTALCVEARDPRRANGPKAEQAGAKSSLLYVFMPPLARAGGLPGPAGRRGSHGARAGREDRAGRLSAAARPAPEAAAGHARPRRDRSQHPSRAQLGRAGAAHRVPVPGGFRDAPVGREVHDRRPPHRHRRRQPLRDGRRDAGRLARSCASPNCWPACCCTGTTIRP